MGAGRKQAVRRQARRARAAEKKATWMRDKARDPGWYGRRTRQPATPLDRVIQAALAVVFIAAFALGILIFLYGQLEIARVMTSGRSAQATVTAVSCSGGNAKTGDVKITFTDIYGNPHKVAHTSDTFDCFDGYHAGDVISIRYVPSDPTMLLTQAEIDSFPWSLVGYVLIDVIFVISPLALLLKGSILWVRQRWAALRARTAVSLDASSTDSPATGDAS